jgi:hypothetical protein
MPKIENLSMVALKAIAAYWARLVARRSEFVSMGGFSFARRSISI